MFRLIKKLIKKVLAKKGLTISPIDDYIERLELVKNNWIKELNINTIIDVGASDGGFARKIKIEFPEAKLYSFEALDDVFIRLNSNLQPYKNIVTENYAVSDKIGEVSFYRCVQSTGSSSLLEMNDVHKVAYPYTQENELVLVNCITLDSYFENKKIQGPTMLKIDVQGAEMLVLKGGTKLLKDIEVIFCEINFIQTYKDCVLFEELNRFLVQHGFRLVGIENVSQSLIDGRFLQADAYFKKQDIDVQN